MSGDNTLLLCVLDTCNPLSFDANYFFKTDPELMI